MGIVCLLVDAEVRGQISSITTDRLETVHGQANKYAFFGMEFTLDG